ncbi:MAG TPA: branched-chain amino acid ABC transporter permease [Hyphomicrobiaceae bacterium]|nr:branched-chain amino acid ABC transporter permease [Hyphomicrobiaceae bacterium]
MPEIMQFLLSGLTVGAIYALVALGFTIIYNASEIVNFAQGEFVMIGGMTTYFLFAAGVPLWIAAPLAIVVAVAVGLALHRFAIAPARGASVVALIIITIGASIFLRGVAQVVFDKQYHRFPAFSGEAPFHVLGATLLPQSVWVMAGTAAALVLLWQLSQRTLAGKAIAATASNALAARLVGIDTDRMIALSFGLSAALGALAGVLITPITLTSYDAGTLLALKGFAAAMLGGMGNPLGAVVGGLLVGAMEQLSAGLISSKYKDAVAFLVILGTLLAMPNGLLGRSRAERV